MCCLFCSMTIFWMSHALTHLKYRLAAARTALWQENFSSWTTRTTSVRQWSRRRPWSSAWICSERLESLKITLSSSSLSCREMFTSCSPDPEVSVCAGVSELFSTESLMVSSLFAERNSKKLLYGWSWESQRVTSVFCFCFLFSF